MELSPMKQSQLLDYLANNDLEIQIVQMDYATIRAAILIDFPGQRISPAELVAAVKAANEDNYIKSYIRPLIRK